MSLAHRAHAPWYRSAVSLNNAAVTMLERGCLRQGLDTLQEAVAVMKAAFQQGSETRPAGKSSFVLGNDEINELVQGATRRSLIPEVVVEINGETSHTIAGKFMRVRSLTYEGTGLTSVLNVLNESPSMTYFYPIRIDALPMEWKQESSTGLVADAEYEAAILVYNFGLANLMLSKFMSGAGAEISGRLQACSFSLFQLASTILSRRADSCVDGMEEADILQLVALVYHASIQILVEAGNDYEASVIYDRYDRVRRAISTIHSHFHAWDYSVKNVSPAA
jgi:hypothetical protein